MAFGKKNRDATQSVATDGWTTAGESDPSTEHSGGLRERLEARLPNWIRTKKSSQHRNDPARHPSSSMQNQPDQSVPPSSPQTSLNNPRNPSRSMQNQQASQTSNDTARHPVSISYPSAESDAAAVITHTKEVARSPFDPRSMQNQQASQTSNDTARHPVSISHPSADSDAAAVITHPEEVARSPLIKDVTASNSVPAFKMAVNSDDATPNIIIFGESGVGKSSLINMITGTDSAATSNEAVGCTFQSTAYDVELKDRKYRLWDTIGLNEGERGTASPERSIQDLQRLVLNLQHEGVNLLVYCIRGSRIRDIIKINYDLFWKIICNEQVPIALVVTGLENEEVMEEWWTNNSEDFAARGMRFHDHACVTTTKGKRMKNGEYIYEAKFGLSIQLVRDLIVERCPKTSWKPDSSRWLIDIVQTMKQMFFQYESQSHGEGYGSHRSQASNESAMPDSLQQFIADMGMAFDKP